MSHEEIKKEQFVHPSVESEIGEIERVAGLFAPDNPKKFIEDFVKAAKKSEVVSLSDEMWGVLENTDSFEISKNGWDEVKHQAVEGHKEAPRDWESLRDKVINGLEVDAPIVVKMGEKIHLVSGNTRLMCARAAGVRPSILLVEMG